MKRFTGLNDHETKRHILKRVREKEYKKRCIAVGVCPWCGLDLKNIMPPDEIHFKIACPDKKCEGHEKIGKFESI